MKVPNLQKMAETVSGWAGENLITNTTKQNYVDLQRNWTIKGEWFVELF